MAHDATDRRAILEAIRTGKMAADEALPLLTAGAGEQRTGDRKRERLDAWLAQMLATEAQVPVAEVTGDTAFEQYGFDSVMALNVVRGLEETFGKLPPTLLFEHQTLSALADYLEREHAATVGRAFGGTVETTRSAAQAAPPADRGAAGEPQGAEPAAVPPENEDAVALVGLSARFPQAESLSQFWENLRAGRDCITEIPQDRWEHRRYHHPEPGTPGASYARWGGFLDRVDTFDAEFFRISPREAEHMDPQERLVLEEVWHAFEDAGTTRQRLAGRPVGVYMGVMYSQYQRLQAEEAVRGNPLALGSSYASIANRVSYFFDLHGPSMALDTMCSSSLTALHLACEALRRGEIEVALAGGVNLSHHPSKFVDLSQGRYASSDGRCRSFGEGGDGYVPGEGVGVAVLKPLSRALADGDRIHAVIRGSALGHGGKTNGYTVPNPHEQANLIGRALADAGVAPEHMSYVEAHGTGTSLGDPIEISALDRAVGRGDRREPCRVGSVKSNIGHLEAAAGIAGLAKVMLQLQHRELVPSLHADRLNPHIDFGETGLRVQRDREPWDPPQGRRIAGVSSFGAGGANAHIVVEEPPPLPGAGAPAPSAAVPQLVVLSALSEERLERHAQRVADYLAAWEGDDRDSPQLLARVGETLRGREALPERLACVVTSRAELVTALSRFADPDAADDGTLVRGSVDRSSATVHQPIAGHEAAPPTTDPTRRDDLLALARHWVAGGAVDWRAVLGEAGAPPVSLPGYPFLPERHWPALADGDGRSLVSRPTTEDSARLHPLLGRNVSTFGRQRFHTVLDAGSSWVRDHMVGEEYVVPAAALVEMVLAAAAHSGLGTDVHLANTGWENPARVPVDRERELWVEFTSSVDGQVDYVVSGAVDGATPLVHARGRVVTGAADRGRSARLADGDVAGRLAAVQANAEAQAAGRDGAACYARFAQRGLVYGPSLRVLEWLAGDADGRAVARLDGPVSAADAAYQVPPALLDGAFQVLAAFDDGEAQAQPWVPVSVEAVTTAGPPPSDDVGPWWVYAERRDTAGSALVADLYVVDQNSRVRVAVTGLVARPAQPASEPATHDTVLLAPEWQPAPAPTAADPVDGTLLVFEEADGALADQLRRDGAARRVVQVSPGTAFGWRAGDQVELRPGDGDDHERLVAEVAQDGPGIGAVVHAWAYAPSSAEASQSAADTELTVEDAALAHGFHSIRALAAALLGQRPVPSVRSVFVHAGTAVHAAVAGFTRSLGAEHPALRFSTWQAPPGLPADAVAQRVRGELAAAEAGAEAREQDGTRQVVRLVERPEPAAGGSPTGALRRGGVYLVTGALGGLGPVVARTLARDWQAKLVLNGRSPEGEDGAELRHEVARLGGEAVYVASDCATYAGASALVAEAKARFGRLDGVLHLAGVLRDGLVRGRDPADTDAVLRPKVWGAWALDAATAAEPLTLFALFSSASGVLGIAGQSDYAFANAYLDQFSQRRAALVRSGHRSGVSVAIGWPLWQAGGMDVDDATKQRIEQDLGWVPMPADTGMAVFRQVVEAELDRCAVFHGHRDAILRSAGALAAEESAGSGHAEPSSAVQAAPAQVPEAAADALLTYLTETLAAELKLPTRRLDPQKRFELLGVESVMVMDLTRRWERVFGELPKTLFFEYPTVRELWTHLLHTYPETVASQFGSGQETAETGPSAVPAPADSPAGPPPSVPAAPATPTVPAEPSPSAGSAGPVGSAHSPGHDEAEPIAIVGVSGRYPLADDLAEYWANLREGRDCIGEVPADRWPHGRFYDPDNNAPGTSYAKWGGFLRDIDRFDPLFFHVSPREARQMDPQERLFLQTAWHAFEDAGHRPGAQDRPRTGVFVGVMYAQYQLYGADPGSRAQGFLPSSLSAAVANRVSFALGLTGPSLALDTMCSSSLTALHYACASIRLGDCDEALAGGVNAITHPNRYLQLSQAKFASSDGRCRSFGDGGDGYVPGEGVGAVLLKRLSRAQADGDHIYAVIRGTAVNHGGRTNGFTVPTPVAQHDVVASSWRAAGVSPREIDYLEAHGTGTALGDPIEIEGLARALAQESDRVVPIGSVKSNIGHLESAAGIAGVTKVLLQMRHRELVPSLHADPVNPNIRFEGTGLRVQRTHEHWSEPTGADGAPRARVAAVSSFGAGGSNAHVVLQECPQPARQLAENQRELIVLSARTEPQLRQVAQQLREALTPAPAVPAAAAAAGASVSDEMQRGEALRAMVADILGVATSDVHPDDALEDDLGFDAAAYRALRDYLQRTYGLNPSTPVGSLRTVRQVAQAVAQSGAGAASHDAPAAGASDDDAAAALPALADVAATLREGREPLSERLAVVAQNHAELRAKLDQFCTDGDGAGLFRGRVDDDEPGQLASVLAGEERAALLAAVRSRGDLAKLGQLWTAGVDISDGVPAPRDTRRVPLPGYPFARERYWIPEGFWEMETAPLAAADPAPPAPAAEPAVPEPAVPEPAAPEPAAPEPATAADTTAVVQEAITTAMAAVLEIPRGELLPDVPHSDFGVDSVLAVEIVDRINTTLGTDLKPTDFFSYATVRKLTEHVVAQGGVTPPVDESPRAPEAASVPEAASTPEPAAAAQDPAPGAPAPPSHAHHDVAVVGMSGRFPEAPDLDTLWANLAAGRDSVGEIPPERWDVTQHWDPDPQAPGKTYSKWGSVLADIDQFDPDFFGMSPREARMMDPQQRLYLMEAWRALEDAGYSDRELDGVQCHAFVGTSKGDYHELLQEHGVPQEGYTFMGTHPAVLASRMSYLLNLRGPSLAVDTSCSSSLMAVHMAFEAIREGRCDLAVAGGVAALTTPELHVLASKAGMLSPTGRCRPFDDDADGFVPGEGVGVVVLKRLDQAIQDGDHIRAVIAGSGANQDGATNGITAPSAPSQAALEKSVYREFGIDPGQIGYVECHGTGTRLGDPIEIEALTEAFRESTTDTAYCALGSIKSNLGHTLTAAGIAGFIKVVLALERGQLPPSLHYDRTNRHLSLADSPFYVGTRLQHWAAPSHGVRQAAVSSFGFSGTNVHQVLRQAPAPPTRTPEAPGILRLVPVSAKTEQALAERLDMLAAWLAGEGSGHEWRDIAYTLSVGRTHYEHRVTFLARGPADLREQIRAWRAGDTRSADVPHGALGAARTAYHQGEPVDWEALFAGEQCRRVPAPTYPFARDSYWVPGLPGPSQVRARQEPERPALPRSVRHTVRASDPMVRDHVVDGRPLLPAAGHLTLVHRALREIVGDVPVTIRRAVWLRPVFVGDELALEVAVDRTDDGTDDNRWRYEVRSTDADGAHVVHSRGEVLPGDGAAGHVDVTCWQQRGMHRVTGEAHYARFDRIGVLYGAHFRTVQDIVLDTDPTSAPEAPREALARLIHDEPGPDLPAGLIDGAIQSVAALQPETPDQRPHVPFAMERVQVLAPVPQQAFAHVHQGAPGECTVTVTDREGRPSVVLEGLSYRELKSEVSTEVYVPRWRRLGPASAGTEAGTEAAASRVAVVAPSSDRGVAERLAAHHSNAAVTTVPVNGHTAAVDLVPDPVPQRLYFLGGLAPEYGEGADDPPWSVWTPDTVDHAQTVGVRALHTLVRELLARGVDNLELVVVTADAHQVHRGPARGPLSASLFGFVRSLAKEQPGWRVRCVDVDLDELATDPEAVVQSVVREPAHPRGNEVALRGGERWARVLTPGRLAPPQQSPYRTGGTYLVLGGAGGIGKELARRLATTAQANVALLGRRPQDAATTEFLAELEAAGGSGTYLSVDATDAAALTEAVQTVRQRYGPIHGVFHSALVLRDGRIEGMDRTTFDAVLAPKIHGTVALAHAVRHEPLDMFVFFSSAQSFTGNEGQANYAAACTAKDAVAHVLAHTGVPVHVVNWGYWGEVGVVATAAHRRRMQAIGVHSIGPDEGMRALETILAHGVPQAMPLKAEPRVLDQFDITLEEVDEEPEGDALQRAHAALDAYGARLVVQAMQRMGAFCTESDRRARATLADELGVVAEHRALWDTLVEIAVDAGLLTPAGEALVGASAAVRLAGQNLAPEGQQLRRTHPAVASHVELLESCVAQYPELLRGEVQPAEVMFPHGSTTLVEQVYQGDPLSDRLNELAAAAVRRYVDQWSGHRPVRILEVGAGTGGTSARILPALAGCGQRVEYTYSDVSLRFLRHGRHAFGGQYPFVEFATLDIERDPHEQGYASGAYDVVVAANVLHATRHLSETMAHVGWLAAADGQLVVVETTAFSTFATLTFGLLEGWWRGEDRENRIPRSPLADVPTWERLFRDAGFTELTPYAPATSQLPLGQHVLVGAKPAHRENGAGRHPGGDLVPDPGASVLDRTVPAPALLETASAPSTANGREANGHSANGHSANGHSANGHSANGHSANGHSANGDGANGHSANGHGADGTSRYAVQQRLGSLIAETMGRTDGELDPDRPFTEYGVDSIILVELVNAINRELGTDLKTTALFDHATLGELAEFVHTEYGPQASAPDVPEEDQHDHDLALLRRLAAGELSLEETHAHMELADE